MKANHNGIRIFAKYVTMKTKLTLSIDSKIVRKAKRDAKGKGKSLSKLFEEKMSGKALPDKRKTAMLQLKKLLDEAKPTKAKSKRIEQKERLEHLMRKYG